MSPFRRGLGDTPRVRGTAAELGDSRGPLRDTAAELGDSRAVLKAGIEEGRHIV